MAVLATRLHRPDRLRRLWRRHLSFTSLTVFLETDLDHTCETTHGKQVRKLHSHFIIICGFGRVGRNVANRLTTTHRHFVAIDSDEVALEAPAGSAPGLVLGGDASDDELCCRPASTPDGCSR